MPYNKITKGRDFNFYQKVEVNWSSFGGGNADSKSPDCVITFPTQSVIFFNEETSGATDKTVEYSFNGNTVHGELDCSLPSRTLTFDNRVVTLIWFRVKSGSSGAITVRVDAWGTR